MEDFTRLKASTNSMVGKLERNYYIIYERNKHEQP